MKRAAADCLLPEEEIKEEEEEEEIKGEEEEESPPRDRVVRASILDRSKHRDGSIYGGTEFWHRYYHVADTRETLLEPMMMSTPTDCRPNMWACKEHRKCAMMQIFSLKLADITAAFDGPIQLYGYLAVRDLLNPLRNYIFNCTRDDPFVVRQKDGDSDFFIQMAGPRRGIEMTACVLIEFDMRIKGEGAQEDDLQLIDGATTFSELTSLHCRPYTTRIEGDCGAVDISLALLNRAVEATIQVEVSEVHGSGIDLSICSFVSRIAQKIQLFQGVIAEPCDLNRFVVAVVKNSALIVREVARVMFALAMHSELKHMSMTSKSLNLILPLCW